MTQITVLKVDQEKAPKGYVVTSVSYKTPDGKVKGMKVYPFGEQAEVAKAFADAKPGDVYDVQLQKNAKDYWEFKPSPTKTGATEKVATPAAKSGNWETTEERAQRQLMIVRQSSISNAIAYMEAMKAKFSLGELKAVAKDFEDFVYGRESKPAPTGDVE